MLLWPVLRLQPQLQTLLQMFAQAVSLWRNMVANGASLDYPSAAEMIQNSEAMSKAFLQACQQVGGVVVCAGQPVETPMHGYITFRVVRWGCLCAHSLTCATCHHSGRRRAQLAGVAEHTTQQHKVFVRHGRQHHAAACCVCACAWHLMPRVCDSVFVSALFACCTGAHGPAAAPLCRTQPGPAVDPGAHDLQHQCERRTGSGTADDIPSAQEEGKSTVGSLSVFMGVCRCGLQTVQVCNCD